MCTGLFLQPVRAAGRGKGRPRHRDWRQQEPAGVALFAHAHTLKNVYLHAPCCSYAYIGMPICAAMLTCGCCVLLQLWYHVVGMPQEQDRFIYAIPEEPEWMIGAEVTDDGMCGPTSMPFKRSAVCLVKLAASCFRCSALHIELALGVQQQACLGLFLLNHSAWHMNYNISSLGCSM